MKVRNLGKRGYVAQQHLTREKKRANESSESRKKGGWQTQSQYQRQKIANESAECREERLLNQRQYQNELCSPRLSFGNKLCFCA